MWYLVNSGGKHIYLKPNTEVTFGRKKSDILLQNDESISRSHASICIYPKDIIEINEPTSICKLKDMDSKYGTYILVGDENRIEVSKEGYNLKPQDRVRFGLQHHIFTVIYLPIITMISTLNSSDKDKLQHLMNEIDGMISADWASNCTHLTVSKATLTEKVTWAMASAIPIVTLNYWEEVKCAIDKGEQLPKSEDFVPLISESLINNGKVSLCPNEKRKTLFKNLIFVYFNARQYKIYGKMINIAGGKSILYSKKPLTHRELCAPNVIVVQYSDSDTMQSTQCILPEYDSIYNVLQANERKMISESDIPLAILHCSVDKYCNPKFRFGAFLKRSHSKSDSSKVLALDTQDVTSDVKILPKIVSNVLVKSSFKSNNQKREIRIIPETCDILSSNDSPVSDIDYQSGRLKSSTPKQREETRETVNSNISFTKKAVQHIKEMCPKKLSHYIPETNDSYSSYMTQESAKSVMQKTSNPRTKNVNIQEIEMSKESMIVNKGTPFNEVIDLSEDETIEPKETQSNKCNRRFNEIFPKNKSRKLVDCVNDVKDRSLEKKTISPEKSDIPTSRKNYNLLKNTSPKMQEKNQQPRKRNFSECESDEELITPVRKRIHSGDLEIRKNIESSQSTSTPFIKKQRSNNNNLSKYNLPFLRVTANYTKFRKVYNMIPKQRITPSEMMHAWESYNV